jgi:hypothetical protein
MSLQLGRVSDLVVHGNRLFGSAGSTLFAIRLRGNSPGSVDTSSLAHLNVGNLALVLDRGQIYGRGNQKIVRIDPVTYEAHVVLDELPGSRLAVDEEHYLYTMADRNLVRVRDKSRR